MHSHKLVLSLIVLAAGMTASSTYAQVSDPQPGWQVTYHGALL